MGAPNRVHPDCPLAPLNMQIVIYKHTAYVLRSYALSSRVELIVLLYCNTAGKSLETNNGSCYKHTAYELGGRVGVGETQCCARCCVA